MSIEVEFRASETKFRKKQNLVKPLSKNKQAKIFTSPGSLVLEIYINSSPPIPALSLLSVLYTSCQVVLNKLLL